MPLNDHWISILSISEQTSMPIVGFFGGNSLQFCTSLVQNCFPSLGIEQIPLFHIILHLYLVSSSVPVQPPYGQRPLAVDMWQHLKVFECLEVTTQQSFSWARTCFCISSPTWWPISSTGCWSFIRFRFPIILFLSFLVCQQSPNVRIYCFLHV